MGRTAVAPVTQTSRMSNASSAMTSSFSSCCQQQFFDELSPRSEAVESLCEGALTQMTKSIGKIRKKKMGSTHTSAVRKKRKEIKCK
jgi:hypothetical protein